MTFSSLTALIIFALATNANAFELPEENTVPACADFLEKLNKKPRHLEFIDCQKIESHGLAALESRYRTKGENAHGVEEYFTKTARMPRLAYFCCGWESIPKNRKNRVPYGVYQFDGKPYQVAMSSEETPVNKRSKWERIPYFYVSVILYLEDS